jgi:hypothetical protein
LTLTPELIVESASINRQEARRISWVDVNTGQTGALCSGVCRLDQAVRATDLDQLACKERSTPSNAASYVFANLDGDVSGSLALPEGKLNPCNFGIASGLT